MTGRLFRKASMVISGRGGHLDASLRDHHPDAGDQTAVVRQERNWFYGPGLLRGNEQLYQRTLAEVHGGAGWRTAHRPDGPDSRLA